MYFKKKGQWSLCVRDRSERKMHGHELGRTGIMGSVGKEIRTCLGTMLCKERPR